MSIIKYIIIPCFLIPSLFLKGQDLQKADLTKTEWRVDNSNMNFYKSDTVYLYRIVDTLSVIQKLNNKYRELDYNKGKDITKIKLKRKGRAEVSDQNVEAWTISNRIKKWKWQYDSSKQMLTLFYAKEQTFTYKVLEIFQDQYSWKYEDPDKSHKENIYHLMVLRLVRIK